MMASHVGNFRIIEYSWASVWRSLHRLFVAHGGGVSIENEMAHAGLRVKCELMRKMLCESRFGDAGAAL